MQGTAKRLSSYDSGIIPGNEVQDEAGKIDDRLEETGQYREDFPGHCK